MTSKQKKSNQQVRMTSAEVLTARAMRRAHVLYGLAVMLMAPRDLQRRLDGVLMEMRDLVIDHIGEDAAEEMGLMGEEWTTPFVHETEEEVKW